MKTLEFNCFFKNENNYYYFYFIKMSDTEISLIIGLFFSLFLCYRIFGFTIPNKQSVLYIIIPITGMFVFITLSLDLNPVCVFISSGRNIIDVCKN